MTPEFAVASEVGSLRAETADILQETRAAARTSRDASERVAAASLQINEVQSRLESVARVEQLSRETASQLQSLNGLAEHVSLKVKALEGQQQTIERAPGLSEFPGATSPLHWFENHEPKNSRAWLVVDPPDGKIPAQTDSAKARAAARAQARRGRGEADSYEDRSLYDRCITRGLPGSMMPAIYGNSYEIVQGPGFVAIKYEMVNETRVIPLDNRKHAGSSIGFYMGDARGHFEGDTLIVETTNFTDKTAYRGSSEDLRIVERFTPVSPGIVEWSVTLDDARTWERPWTFAMNLTLTNEPPFEYACHEGNYAMFNILSVARAEEAAAAAKK